MKRNSAPGELVPHTPAKKHAAKKHAAKKHAAKHAEKHAAKHAAKAAKKSAKHAAPAVPAKAKVLAWQPDSRDSEEELFLAFHHMQRAGAVISLLEPESGGDLRSLLEHGIDLYRHASDGRVGKRGKVKCASGLLRAAEHLGMAGLYSARSEHRIDAPIPSRAEIAHHLDTLDGRLNEVSHENRQQCERLKAIARELLRRAEAAGNDSHLEYELTMAADGICSALEAGL